MTYTLFPLLVWTDIEMCAAVISACLPTMLPVMLAAGAKMGFRSLQTAGTRTMPTFGSGSAPRRKGSEQHLTISEDIEMTDGEDSQSHNDIS